MIYLVQHQQTKESLGLKMKYTCYWTILANAVSAWTWHGMQPTSGNVQAGAGMEHAAVSEVFACTKE